LFLTLAFYVVGKTGRYYCPLEEYISNHPLIAASLRDEQEHISGKHGSPDLAGQGIANPPRIGSEGRPA